MVLLQCVQIFYIVYGHIGHKNSQGAEKGLPFEQYHRCNSQSGTEQTLYSVCVQCFYKAYSHFRDAYQTQKQPGAPPSEHIIDAILSHVQPGPYEMYEFSASV